MTPDAERGRCQSGAGGNAGHRLALRPPTREGQQAMKPWEPRLALLMGFGLMGFALYCLQHVEAQVIAYQKDVRGSFAMLKEQIQELPRSSTVPCEPIIIWKSGPSVQFDTESEEAP